MTTQKPWQDRFYDEFCMHFTSSELQFVYAFFEKELKSAFEEGRADCKHKAETAALMALNACGVPEEEAVKHARIAVDSVF